MKRHIRRSMWTVPVLCMIAISCADGIVEPRQATSVDAVSIDAAPPHGTGAPHSLGNDACAPGAQLTVGEPLPEDLCSVARFLPDAPRPGRAMEAAIIGPGGGSLQLGEFEIIVPAGAVSTPTLFAIRLPPPGNAADRALAEFAPHNVTFAVPVVIRLPRANTEAAPGAPVMWWQQSTKTWIDQTTTDLSDGRIEASVDHFSYYATRLRGVTIAGG